MNRDRTFLIAIGFLFGFMTIFSVGVTVLGFVHDASDQVTFRVIAAIGSMFSTVSALALGYLVGRRNGGNGH